MWYLIMVLIESMILFSLIFVGVFAVLTIFDVRDARRAIKRPYKDHRR
jgi:hypothetical protein